jgi:hypothetical protein
VIGGQHELGKGQSGLLRQSDCGIERRTHLRSNPKIANTRIAIIAIAKGAI